MKAYFLQRVVAYFIDAFIITILLMFLKAPFPTSTNYQKLVEKENGLYEKALNKEITMEEYIKISSEVNYELEKENYIWVIVNFAVSIVYFVWYQVYTKGQTLGKKLMKIVVKKKDGSDISINDSIKRAIVLHGMLFTLINLITILFLSANNYILLSGGLQLFYLSIFIVSVFMVAIRKDGRGLHDLFANTEVLLLDKRVSESVLVNDVVTAGNAGTIKEAVIVDEGGSEEDEGTSRTRSGKKRKNKGDK